MGQTAVSVVFCTFEMYVLFTTKTAGNEPKIQNFIKMFLFVALFAIVAIMVIFYSVYINLQRSPSEKRYDLISWVRLWYISDIYGVPTSLLVFLPLSEWQVLPLVTVSGKGV